jgi:hypothetical protein
MILPHDANPGRIEFSETTSHNLMRNGQFRFAAQMVCADAGLHADQATLHSGKPGRYLAIRPLLAQHASKLLSERGCNCRSRHSCRMVGRITSESCTLIRAGRGYSSDGPG